MEERIKENRNQADTVSLKDLILRAIEWCRFLLSKWIIIICFGIIGGTLGFAYADFKKPVYTAITTFVLEDDDKGGGLGQYAGLASMAGIDIGGGGGVFKGDNILELYKSRRIIEKTLLTEVKCNGKSQLLVDRFIDFNNLREKWDKNPRLKGIQFKTLSEFTRAQDSILGSIASIINKSYLNVSKPDKKLSVFKAEVKTSDEFFAKTFNEEIVRNVNDFYIQTKTKKSLTNIAILQQKTDSVRNMMNGAIFAGATVADVTPNLNPTRQAQRVAPMQRSQFSAETNKLILGELVKNLELSKISLRKETPLIQVIDEPILPLEKTFLSTPKGIVLGAFLSMTIVSVILLMVRFFKNFQ